MGAVAKRPPGRELTVGGIAVPAAMAPGWLLYFAGFMIVLVSLAHIPPVWPALNYFDPPKRFLWGVLALLLALGARKEENRLGRSALCLALALLGWMALRTLSRPVPLAELDVLFSWMVPLILLVLGASLSCGRGRRFLGGCLLMAGGIQATLMLLQRAGLDPLFSETTLAMGYAPGRMVGTIGYHNQAVDFLSLSTTGVILLSKSFAVRMGVMLPFFAVACMTGNRGGILAFASALLLFHAFSAAGSFRYAGQKRRWILAGGFTLLAAILMAGTMLAPEMRGRFRDVLHGARDKPAVASRLHMAGIAVDMIRERPWTGAGAGEYALQYLDRLGNRLPETKDHQILQGVVFAREAHNDGLQFMAEFGGIGLLMAAGLIAMGAVRAKHSWAQNPDSVLACGFIATYMSVSSLFSFPWQTSMAAPMAGLMLGWWWPVKNGYPDPAGGKSAGGCGSVAKWAMVALSVLTAGWYAAELFMTVAVPTALEKDPASAAGAVLHPYAYQYRALIGASLAQQGDVAAAEAELRDADRGYRDVLLWNNLANVYAQQGEWAEAAALYGRWAQCGLDHANALMNLSVACEQMGRFGEAARWLSLRRILFQDRALPETKRLAALYLKDQQPYAAREVLELSRHQWQKVDLTTRAEFANLTGAAAIGQGNLGDAEYRLLHAVELNPDLESARRNLALLEQLRSNE